jgi:hypothetical protein
VIDYQHSEFVINQMFKEKREKFHAPKKIQTADMHIASNHSQPALVPFTCEVGRSGECEKVKKICNIFITEFVSLSMLKIKIGPIDRPELNRFRPYIFSRTRTELLKN